MSMIILELICIVLVLDFASIMLDYSLEIARVQCLSKKMFHCSEHCGGSNCGGLEHGVCGYSTGLCNCYSQVI